ncbi:profilin-like [Montipora capricornis]|uniref:profilin-like n=1 Tax=Montipora capricornis TaxID=246305 RepID=UPI0035F1F8EF
MSWDGYIDNLIAQTKDSAGKAHCDKACIIGLDGGAPWTTNSHASALQLQGVEGQTIANCLKSKDFTALQSGGVNAEGVRYQFLREEDGKLVLAKKKDHGALTLQASKTAIVIGHTAEGCQQGNTNKGVGVIAEYLESLGM